MGDVVDLDSMRSHALVPMRCTDCNHRFWSVHLASVQREYWQCPACGELAAVEVRDA